MTDVLLSTSSVFPEPTSAGFEMAATLGYDGVEVMVWTDAVSQDAAALRGLSEHYGVKVGSVHAPCLLVTQRVWSPDPWERLRRSAELAETLGAPIVVIHPPFSWQRDYARRFKDGLYEMSLSFGSVSFAVENMFPVRMAGRSFVPYSPGYDPTEVEGFLALLAEELANRIAQSDKLERENRYYRQRVEETEHREHQLQQTLLRAQKVSDDVTANARREAELVVKEAEIAADKIVQHAIEQSTRFEAKITDLRTARRELQLKFKNTLDLFERILEAEMEDERNTATVLTLPRKRREASGA